MLVDIEQPFRAAAPGLNTAPFGDLLRGLRVSAALSQEELAERAGLSLRGISDLERGARRAPHLTTVRLLAEALALNAVDLQSLIAAARPALQPDMACAPVPAPLTSPVGRETELATLSALVIRVAERLVTLNGPTGVDKTCFASELAAGLSVEFGGGVVFVALTAVPEPALAAATIPAGGEKRPGTLPHGIS
jgi:transcriptional regulator with XRE-family HTH domain